MLRGVRQAAVSGADVVDHVRQDSGRSVDPSIRRSVDPSIRRSVDPSSRIGGSARKMHSGYCFRPMANQDAFRIHLQGPP
jgi:hypothetical protein